MQTSAKNSASQRNHPDGDETPPLAETKCARKVAVVDDVAELKELYSVALRKHGHDVVFVASSGEEAIEAAKNGKFSKVEYVLIDYRMPGMNGLEAAEKILGFVRSVKIVILSADTSIKNQVEAVGFKFVSKPFTIAELIECIV